MTEEIELRFKNFDYPTIKQKILELGFVYKGTKLFKVTKYKSKDKSQKIRVRKEGEKTLFNIKIKTSGYDLETELEVEDYDKFNKMLQMLGNVVKCQFDKSREIYYSEKYLTEVIFDYFEGDKSYMEVESKEESQLFHIVKELNLKIEPKFSYKDFMSTHALTH